MANLFFVLHHLLSIIVCNYTKVIVSNHHQAHIFHVFFPLIAQILQISPKVTISLIYQSILKVRDAWLIKL